MSYSAIVAVLLLAVLVAIAVGPAAMRTLARRSSRGGERGRSRDETTVLEVAAIERLYGREGTPHPVRAKPRGDGHDDS